MAERAHVRVAIVGGGPMGLQLACALARRGVAYVVLERGNVGASIEGFPVGMRFLPNNRGLEIDGVPLESAGERVTREEYLAYLRHVVRMRNLQVRTGHEVVEVQREPEGAFLVRARCAEGDLELHAERVVLAVGEFEQPVRLGIPGEDLPHVSHFFRGTEGLGDKRVLIVGGGNSATEAAWALVEAGAQVRVCLRRDRFRGGPRITRENEERVRTLAAAGRLDLRYWTELVRIGPDRVQLRRSDGSGEEVPADCVLLLTGYEPDLSLLAGAGGSPHEPGVDPMTLESAVPGLYLAGTAAARAGRGRAFIKQTPKHAFRIVAHLHGEPVPERFRPARHGGRRPPRWRRRLTRRRQRWEVRIRRGTRRLLRRLRALLRRAGFAPG